MERTKGLVIKQTDYGEGNRMLTIFTEDFGIIKASVYGVKKGKSRQSAATQFLNWSEFMLYFGKGDVATVNSVTSIESFFPIQENFEKLALCAYLADITYTFQVQNMPNSSVLRLFLNTLYALAYKELPIEKAKAVFELRLIRDMGFMPTVNCCSACGDEGMPEYFSSECGGILCRNCHSALRDDLHLSPEAYKLLVYILYAEEKKIYSFNSTETAMKEISAIAENYFISKAERSFSSLEYLKKLGIVNN